MEVSWTLVFIGFLLMGLELFVPGGILGVIGLLCLLGAVIGVWAEYGTNWGLLALLCVLLASLLLVVVEMTLLRRSPLGKHMFLFNKNLSTAPKQTPEADVVGRTGEAVTTMAPTGVVSIGGRRYEAASQDGLLERGAAVRVVSRDAFRLIVRREGQDDGK